VLRCPKRIRIHLASLDRTSRGFVREVAGYRILNRCYMPLAPPHRRPQPLVLQAALVHDHPVEVRPPACPARTRFPTRQPYPPLRLP
jgi:hypothetical protein